jgi:acyl-CoA dehydrogenase
MILGRAIYTPEDEALRDQIIRFCENEIAPHGEAWEEAGGFPRELYKKAGDAGVLGLGFSEEYGGSGGNVLHYCMVREEICKTGFAGVRVGLMAHGIGLPPIIHHASNALKNQVADKHCLEKNNLFSYLGAKRRIGYIKYNNKGGS